MPTSPLLPPQVQRPGAPAPALAQAAAEAALVQAPPIAPEAVNFAVSPVHRLAVELDVVIPVREFRVRNLLALDPGNVIETQWSQSEDVPLGSGDVLLAWSEFEVMEGQLAVRVTRLV